MPSTAATELSFQNRSAEKRRIYWIDDDGDRKFYGIVEPGNVFKQPTFANHAWVVTDDAEKCLYTFVATAEPRAVDVGEASAAIAAPPAGAQQPIAQAAPPPPAPPPAAVQAPPPVAQAAPPPASQDPATVIASTAAEPLPQVSPVEQFQLNGAYRLATQADGTKVLNSQTSGTLDVTAARPEWDSAQWMFEPVSGTPFVRIRNKWKGTYLADFNGKPRAMPAAPNATEAQWTFEPVDGTPYVQFRNRETDRFLLSINGAAALVDDFRQDMENNSLWRPVPAAGAVAAAPPPPQRPLYDSAVSSCRQIGGYWTGSSCKRPVYITQPLVCPRGFVWAEEVGECLWDGGSCPPWQQGPGGVCGPNMVCRGGAVAPGPRGFPACYCPSGQVAWGNYPNLSCVPSIARVAPLLIPAVIAGTAIAIIGSNQGRPTIGQVYGNNRFCPSGTTGTPPNCVVAATCPPPLVGKPPNCLRLVPKPTPVVNTTTPVTPQAITCRGGSIVAGACQCPPQWSLTGGGTEFQCVLVGSAKVCPQGYTRDANGNCVAPIATGTPTNPICNLGERIVDGKCVNLNAAITCTGGTIAQGTCGCPPGTRLTGGGNNFQCVASNQPTGGGQIGDAVTTTIDQATGVQTTKTTNANGVVTTQQTCAAGWTGSPPNCAVSKVTRPDAGPRACNVGEVPQSANCLCKDPLFIFDGKCAQQTLAKPLPLPTRSCTVGEVPQSANCLCKEPLFIFDGKCAQQTLAKPLPLPTRSCTVGEVPQSANCLCKEPLFIFDGKCAQQTLAKPNTNPRQCSAGEKPQAANCLCKAPLQIAANGICGPPSNIRLAPAATCPAGQTGAPPNCKPAAPVACPAGQVGTPPNCKPAAPAVCPSGQVGTPPNCRPAPPAACPAGQVGTPPNCRPAPPAACPAGQVGTPPNCRPQQQPTQQQPKPPPTFGQPQNCPPPKKLTAQGCV